MAIDEQAFDGNTNDSLAHALGEGNGRDNYIPEQAGGKSDAATQVLEH